MSRSPRPPAHPLRAAVLLPFGMGLGCDTSLAPQPIDRRVLTGVPEGEGATIRRFMETYSQRRSAEYAQLFTGDFRFEFSNAADPGLAGEHPGGWTKADEVAAATNLFQGGVNEDGASQSAALDISLQFVQTLPVDDNGEGRDPEFYKVLLTPVDLDIFLPGDLTYLVGRGIQQSHRLFLVRGDRAADLDPDQPADANHWYIWKWRDESPPLKPQAPTAAETATWGRVKALYR